MIFRNRKPSFGEITAIPYRQHRRYGGVIGHWMHLAGGGPNLFDIGGYGQNGAIDGAAWSVGRVGGALSYDGGNDSTAVADNDRLDLTGGYLISFWIKPASFGEDDRIIDKGGGTDDGYTIEIGLNSNIQVRHNDSTGITSSNNSLVVDTWAHVVVRNDAGTVNIFIDGVLDGSGTHAVPNASTHVLTFAKKAGVASNYYDGEMDDIRMYGYPAPDAVVASLFDAQFLEFEPQPPVWKAPAVVGGRIARYGDLSGLTGHGQQMWNPLG